MVDLLQKPNFNFTPRDIRGDVPVKEVNPNTLGLSSADAKDINEVLQPESVRDSYPKELRDSIDNCLIAISSFQDQCQRIEDRCYDEMKDLRIEYNPNDFPDVHDAVHCPLCGIPSAGNIIDVNSIKAKTNKKKALVDDMMDDIGFNSCLSNDSDNPAQDLNSEQQKKTKNNIMFMLVMVLKQILIWVIEVILKFFSPLRKVPFAKAIPKALNRLIKRLKKTKYGETHVADLSADEKGESDNEVEHMDYDDDLLLDMPISLSDVGSTVNEMDMLCHKHIQNFDTFMFLSNNPAVRTSAFILHNVNIAQQRMADTARSVAEMNIQPGYTVPVTTVNTKELKVRQLLPSEYVRRTEKGAGGTSAFFNGMGDVALKATKEYGKVAEEILDNWVNSPEVLCCFIKNCIKIGLNTKDGKKILMGIRAFLLLLKNGFVFDFNSDISDLFNIINEVVNTIIRGFISSISSLISNKITNGLAVILDKNKIKAKECYPFQNLLDMVDAYIKKLLSSILEYNFSFITAWDVEVNLGVKISKKLKDADAVDVYIKWIDIAIRMINTYDYCLENDNPITASSTYKTNYTNFKDFGDVLDYTNDIASDAVTTATQEYFNSVKSSISNNSDILNNQTTTNSISKNTVSNEMENYLVTAAMVNYGGVTIEKAKDMLEHNVPCNCDKVLTDSELNEIKRQLENVMKSNRFTST